METKVKTGAEVKGTNAVADKKAPQFVAGNPVNAVSQKEETGKEPKAESTKGGFVNVNQEAEKAKSEPTKLEIKKSIVEKIAEQRAILERHIKLGDELARKIRHRDNLKNIITTLDEFELVLKDNADETDGNYYQGCLLTIKDDNGKTFTTKNPTIIKGVAEQVNSLCTEKLEEVETDIVNLIPA
ncbi:hypothetical protein SAMN04487898_12271 [Pedobacter sp. ok626]|uniref:hypothetical protein n=1 Tax=Pedobacter sp. ok626 TaxID=1761882 RepID=UPI00088E15D1|nr:hypothetical protein [Pedobacter sp. ok626]SDL66858.1 hypothetical protein SAMN04487898_12271 [Pedobacter sp. ok626]